MGVPDVGDQPESRDQLLGVWMLWGVSMISSCLVM